MTDADLLALRFEAHRDRLRAVALRMLGSTGEADDAVQEAWLRLNRTGADAVDNLGGWLTTVVARVCLDMLRARARRKVSADDPLEPVAAASPEDEALLADSVGLALLVVLDTLSPAERLAFVLHDMFGVPFTEIAPIVGRTSGRRPPAGQPGPAAGAGGPRGPRRLGHHPARGGGRLPGRLAPRRLRGAAAAPRPHGGAAGGPDRRRLRGGGRGPRDRRGWPRRSPAGPRGRGSPSSTAWPGRCGRSAADRRWSLPSRSAPAGSSPSRCSASPRRSEPLPWRHSTSGVGGVSPPSEREPSEGGFGSRRPRFLFPRFPCPRLPCPRLPCSGSPCPRSPSPRHRRPPAPGPRG